MRKITDPEALEYSHDTMEHVARLVADSEMSDAMKVTLLRGVVNKWYEQMAFVDEPECECRGEQSCAVCEALDREMADAEADRRHEIAWDERHFRS